MERPSSCDIETLGTSSPILPASLCFSLCLSIRVCASLVCDSAHPSVCLPVSAPLPSPTHVPSVCISLSLSLSLFHHLPSWLLCLIAALPWVPLIFGVCLPSLTPSLEGWDAGQGPSPPLPLPQAPALLPEAGTWTSPGWCPPAGSGQPLGEEPAAQCPEAMRTQAQHGQFGAGTPFTPRESPPSWSPVTEVSAAIFIFVSASGLPIRADLNSQVSGAQDDHPTCQVGKLRPTFPLKTQERKTSHALCSKLLSPAVSPSPVWDHIFLPWDPAHLPRPPL